jgi:hypothetical protein
MSAFVTLSTRGETRLAYMTDLAVEDRDACRQSGSVDAAAGLPTALEGRISGEQYWRACGLRLKAWSLQTGNGNLTSVPPKFVDPFSCVLSVFKHRL